MHVFVVFHFGNGGGLLFIFFYTIMEKSAGIKHITRIKQVTLKTVNRTILIYN